MMIIFFSIGVKRVNLQEVIDAVLCRNNNDASCSVFVPEITKYANYRNGQRSFLSDVKFN